MKTLVGTGRLIKLALRRDRIKLPVWILVILTFMAVEVPAVSDVYGGTEEQRSAYASTAASSMIARLLAGPIGGTQIGEVYNTETFAFMAILIAFMSILLVVRHTRQNEETGRSEIIASAITGRGAALTAALALAVGVNILLSTLLALGMWGLGLPAEGSFATAAAYGAIGICFAGVAAITSQIADSARGANSLAALGVGVAFLLRGIGDSLGKVGEDGMSVTSAWPSWLSPLGWGQQIHGFISPEWMVFGLFGAFVVVLSGAAYYLNARRDIGLGLLPARKGPASAARSLLSAWGLARRLQRGTLIGWSAVFLVMGLTTGVISKEFSEFFDSSPELRQYLESVGGGQSINDILFSAMTAIMAITAGAYVVHALQRMRSEEVSGHLEPVIGTSVHKPVWLLSHFIYAAAGVTLLMALFGISSAVTYILVNDGAAGEIWRLTVASLAYIPSLLVIAAAVAFVFGLLPRAAIALSWVIFVFCMFVSQFSEPLRLPQVIANISPFTHVPPTPSEPMTVMAAVVMSAAALAILGAALVSFRRRDLTTN